MYLDKLKEELLESSKGRLKEIQKAAVVLGESFKGRVKELTLVNAQNLYGDLKSMNTVLNACQVEQGACGVVVIVSGDMQNACKQNVLIGSTVKEITAKSVFDEISSFCGGSGKGGGNAQKAQGFFTEQFDVAALAEVLKAGSCSSLAANAVLL